MSEVQAREIDRNSDRPVLLWLEDGDETHVKSGIQQAGDFLGVSAEDVRAAIASGEPLRGWFVDWEAQGAER